MKYDREEPGRTTQSFGAVGHHSYAFLKRTSSRLGRVAMHAFNDVRDVLHKEIKLPPSRQFFSSLGTNLTNGTPTGNVNQLANVPAPDEDLLKEIVQKSNEIIADARAVWPFDFFPNEIMLDRTKVTIIERTFFWSRNVMSFRVEDILNVSVATGPFFGSITIASRVMSTVDHFTVAFLWRRDAIYLKSILQGYLIAQQNKIDVSHLTHDTLIETLIELGHDTYAPR